MRVTKMRPERGEAGELESRTRGGKVLSCANGCEGDKDRKFSSNNHNQQGSENPPSARNVPGSEGKTGSKTRPGPCSHESR